MDNSHNDPATPDDRPTVYSLTLRVRQYEVDILGHVNNAVYLNYLEQAAVEHAESLGLTHERLTELGGLFVVRRHEIDYLGAARAGDALRVSTWIESFKGARAVRAYEILHVGTGRRIIAARTLWAWIDAERMVPRPMPRALLDAFPPIGAPPA